MQSHKDYFVKSLTHSTEQFIHYLWEFFSIIIPYRMEEKNHLSEHKRPPGSRGRMESEEQLQGNSRNIEFLTAESGLNV
jgi:hypothetical protein